MPSITGDRMASVVEHALETVPCDLLLVPTRGGTVARAISRCKPPVWVIAPSSDPTVCQKLAFSYGVHPVDLIEEPDDWREWIARWLNENGITAHLKQICNVECRSNGRHKYQPRVRLRVSTRNDIFNVESISVEAFMTNTAGPPSKRHISTEDVCCAEQLEVDASGLAP